MNYKESLNFLESTHPASYNVFAEDVTTLPHIFVHTRFCQTLELSVVRNAY